MLKMNVSYILFINSIKKYAMRSHIKYDKMKIIAISHYRFLNRLFNARVVVIEYRRTEFTLLI